MLHGKKGFERIVWAFKNVLNSSVTWLFYDFESKHSAVADVCKVPLTLYAYEATVSMVH